jgi:hypothetical protein
MKTWFVGPKRTYSLTEEDKLWLARAIAGETGETPRGLEGPASVAWAMINRFLLSPAQSNWPRFTDLLRAFCQPINPKWALGGSKCPDASPDKADPCYSGKLARREHIASLTWAEIHADIRSLVESFAAGQVFLPDKVLEMPHWRLSNWAAFHVDSSKRHEEINLGDNIFFEDLNLIGCEVHVVQSDTAPAPECFPVSRGVGGGWTTLNTLGVVLALGAAGIAAYLAWARTHS